MRKLTLLLFFISTTIFSADNKTGSEIKEVIVYLNGAQITRLAPIYLESGINEIILNDLSPKIDENSIQISGLGDASILSINYNINYLDKKKESKEVNDLINEIKLIERKIALQKNLIKGLNEEEELLITNRKLVNENQSVTLAKIQEFSKYYRERIEMINTKIFDANILINEFDNVLRNYNKQLTEISSNTKEKRGEIKIKLDATKSTLLNLTVKYHVSSAGWFPVYDIKAKSTKAPLNLKYRAHLYQKTGEDWSNVKITLSTGDPTINNNKPELETHFLDFSNKFTNNKNTAIQSYTKKYNPMIKRVVGTIVDEKGQPLSGVNVIVKGTSNGTTTDFDGEYSIDIEHGEELAYSYVGFSSHESPIYSSVMNIQLTESIELLEEVVTIGYGTARNRKGSVASVLQGRAAGVPVRVRGASSVKNDNKILYVVDGIPMEDISYLDPNEIKSMDVLKDSSATSIYGARATNGVVVVTTREYIEDENIMNKQFIIKKSYSIASVNNITVIDIDTFELPTTYEYLAAPIINENVFLIAEINNWEHLDLLPGEANVYFDGSYGGKTYINPSQTSEELRISLGVDSNIIVSRKQVNDLKDISFVGNTRIVNKTYELTLKNNKDSEVIVNLLDRIPISQNKEIKVDKTEYGDANYNSKKGILQWDITLSPSENIKKEISFQLKYPKEKRVNL